MTQNTQIKGCKNGCRHLSQYFFLVNSRKRFYTCGSQHVIWQKYSKNICMFNKTWMVLCLDTAEVFKGHDRNI